MKKFLIFMLGLISVNAMAFNIVETYTFRANAPLADQDIVYDENGMQFAFLCDLLEGPKLTFLFKHKSVRFKDKEECESVKSAIRQASDKKPVEIDISNSKILQVRVHQ